MFWYSWLLEINLHLVECWPSLIHQCWKEKKIALSVVNKIEILWKFRQMLKTSGHLLQVKFLVWFGYDLLRVKDLVEPWWSQLLNSSMSCGCFWSPNTMRAFTTQCVLLCSLCCLYLFSLLHWWFAVTAAHPFAEDATVAVVEILPHWQGHRLIKKRKRRRKVIRMRRTCGFQSKQMPWLQIYWPLPLCSWAMICFKVWIACLYMPSSIMLHH